MSIVRFCDAGSCLQPANFIASFTGPRNEAQTRAACTHQHLAEVDAHLRMQGYTPGWNEFYHGPDRIRARAATAVKFPNNTLSLELEQLP